MPDGLSIGVGVPAVVIEAKSPVVAMLSTTTSSAENAQVRKGPCVDGLVNKKDSVAQRRVQKLQNYCRDRLFLMTSSVIDCLSSWPHITLHSDWRSKREEKLIWLKQT